MSYFQFPRYVSGGLYLAVVHGDIAVYQRPRLTGNWNLEAQYINNQIVCTDCLGAHLIGRILTPITEEEFLEDNGRGQYTVEQLISY